MSGMSLGLIWLVTALAYSGVYTAGFVWDDFPLVVDNPLTSSFSHASEWFVSDLWRGLGVEGFESGFYRPLVLASFAVDRVVLGGEPGLAHLHSLLWHLGVIALLFGLLVRLFGRAEALVGATFFALHPVQSEAVVWIAARNDLMSAFFLLGSLWFLLNRRPSKLFLVLGGVGFFLALLSKESSLLGGAFLFFLDRARWGPGGIHGPLRYMSLGIAASLWLWLRFSAGVQTADLDLGTGASLMMENGSDVFSHYSMMLFWPLDLSVGRTLEYMGGPSGPVMLGLLIGGFAVFWVLFWGGTWGRTGLAIAVLGFLPSLVAMAAKAQLGERYLYVPMLGLSVVVVSLVKHVRWRGVLWLAFVVFGFLGVQRRVPDWQSEISLWQAAVDTDPSPYTVGNLGHMHNRHAERLRDAGRNAEAMPFFQAAMDGFEQSFAHSMPYLDNCAILVRAPLRRQAFERGLRNAEVGERAGCLQHPTQAGSFAGIHAALLALTGDWEAAGLRLGWALEDPKGRGEILRGSLMLLDSAMAEGKPPFVGYCALRPQDAQEARLFDEAVLRLLEVGGRTPSLLFDASGTAVVSCLGSTERN